MAYLLVPKESVASLSFKPVNRSSCPLIFFLEQSPAQNYFDVRQTLEEKVMNASSQGGGVEGEKAGVPPAAGSGSLFSFGERSVQSQRAKKLAKLNTPYKRFEKKVVL